MKLSNVAQLKETIVKSRKVIEEKLHGKRHIIICGDTGCLSSNSAEIKDRLATLIKEKKLDVTLDNSGCFGFCSQGPFLKVMPEDVTYKLVRVEDVEEIVENHLKGGKIVDRLLFKDANGKSVTKEKDVAFYAKQKKIALYGCGVVDPNKIEESFGFGGYEALAKALSGKPIDVIAEIQTSGLRGRGGGGFPTGNKWKFAYDQQATPKYVVCNADEGDPGAFMDRSILEGNPHSVIEGMIIAGYAIGASRGFIYIRAEYPGAVKKLHTAIEQAHQYGILGDNILGTDFSFDIEVRLGAGAFVCGEETALLNSIEGKRGMPNPKPPFPAIKGLWGQPTIINNVETFANVPWILREGAAEFVKIGTEKSRGTKVFALAGKVNNIGLVEVPMGTTLRELIYEIGGGVVGGKQFKAIQTGGPSGGCLTKDDLDTPIDYDNLIAKGSMMGSGGAIVMDEDNCMVAVAKFYLEFICDESCGKCTPCRIGTKRMLEILEKITEGRGEMEDITKLEELAAYIKDASLCGLGQTAPNPILSTLTKFRDEYIAHIVDKKCPAKVCKKLISYEVDESKCKKCSACQRACPVGAISGEAGKTTFKIDSAKCIRCGACVATCKFGAISAR